KYIRNHLSDKKFIVAHPGTPYSDLERVPEELPAKDPEWKIDRKYIARSQICDSSGRACNPPNIGGVSGVQDRTRIKLIQGNPEKPAILIYLLAPGSFPSTEKLWPLGKRIALENNEIPIVGITVNFPGEKLNKYGTSVVSVKGIRSE
ncbi:MAG TPA: hypothetical protein D7I06_06085, partial [Candidatus Poseidoniales archaeon]